MRESTRNKIIKFLVLFVIGGIIYYCIELGFRGYSFLLMAICGGLAFVSVGYINEFIPWEIPIIIQSIFSSFVIMFWELTFGLIFNTNHQMWDYTNLPFNYKGQICLYFGIIWCFVGCFAIILDDYLRYWIFGEEKPHYKLF